MGVVVARAADIDTARARASEAAGKVRVVGVGDPK
jgi:formate-dependent phosphoribosylglycinamide formyltransferase (GAR transformylase)